MAFSKELIFLVMFFVHTNAAINFNIFNFNRSARPNVTAKESIPIIPTKTNSASLEFIHTPTEIANYSLPELNAHVDSEKHEFENETEAVDASPENTDDVKPQAPIPGGQEIDETRNSSRYSVNETINEVNAHNESKKLSSMTVEPIGTVSAPKSHGLPKKKTVTFTTTIVSKFTKYETAYPSCVKLENVKSVCNGKLITILPTPTISNVVNEKTKMSNNTKDETFDDSFDIIEPPEIRKKRTANSAITLKNLKESDKLDPLAFIESSEKDYEFEEFGALASNKNLSENLQGRETPPIAEIESLWVAEPKFEFATKYLSSTTVQTVTNYDITATVIAHNCIPRNINLKECPKTPRIATKQSVVPITPVIKKTDVTKSKKNQDINTNEKTFFAKPSPSLPPEQEPHKPLDSINELNQYLVMNGDRLIHGPGGGHETIDLNAGSTIIKPSLEESPVQYRKRSNRVKRER